jgi:cell division transport system ATP-binding protein
MLQLFNVSYQYNQNYGVTRLTFAVRNGEFAFLVGPSGAGKTTIFRLVNLELFPQQGHIILDSLNTVYLKPKDIPYIRRKLGIVFQDFKLLPDRSVYDNVAFAMLVVGAPRRKIKRRVLEVLKEVGLSHKRMKYPKELSGGEQQRVAIARALVNEPFILLADEPTGNLDRNTAIDILRLLERINSQGTAILMATHNDLMARSSHKRILYIKNGRLQS